jgi:hypothetical protein
MGEARRKLDADACGIARPRDNRCPGCGSRRLHMIHRGELGPHNADADWQGCIDCGAVWEPFPPVYARDPVCADPCDNCAFRPGSPEQADTEGWRQLIEKLKPDASYSMFTGRFYCHKGVPIDMDKGPGNFLFPQKTLTMDGEPVRNQDGTVNMIEDTAKMRVCSGFLRFCWKINEKAEKRMAR